MINYNISCQRVFFKVRHPEVQNSLAAIIEHICLVKNSGTKRKAETKQFYC